jgi:hypothetical protein
MSCDKTQKITNIFNRKRVLMKLKKQLVKKLNIVLLSHGHMY